MTGYFIPLFSKIHLKNFIIQVLAQQEDFPVFEIFAYSMREISNDCFHTILRHSA